MRQSAPRKAAAWISEKLAELIEAGRQKLRAAVVAQSSRSALPLGSKGSDTCGDHCCGEHVV